MQKVNIDNGYIIFKLDDILKQKGISMNKLMRDTNTDFKVIQRLVKGESTKLDIFVLGRFCNYLKCDLTEIIEYKNK